MVPFFVVKDVSAVAIFLKKAIVVKGLHVEEKAEAIPVARNAIDIPVEGQGLFHPIVHHVVPTKRVQLVGDRADDVQVLEFQRLGEPRLENRRQGAAVKLAHDRRGVVGVRVRDDRVFGIFRLERLFPEVVHGDFPGFGRFRPEADAKLDLVSAAPAARGKKHRAKRQDKRAKGFLHGMTSKSAPRKARRPPRG